MPRPKPNFHNLAKEYLSGYRYDIPNLDKFNMNTSFYVYCNDNPKHKYKVTFSRLKSGLIKLECPHCKLDRKDRFYPEKLIRDYLSSNNYSLINNDGRGYTKDTTPIEYKCDKCNKEFKATVAKYFVNKTMKSPLICKGCQEIVNKSKWENKLTDINIENDELLETNYENVTNQLKQKLDLFEWNVIKYTSSRTKNIFQCKVCFDTKETRGNPLVIRSGDNKITKGCKKCKSIGYKQGVIDTIKDQCIIKDIVPLFETYHDIYSDLKFGCNKCGKEFVTNWKRVNGSSYSINCPNCNTSNKRLGQNSLRDYISSVYNGEIITEDRKIIYPKEIDIYLPNIKVGIEYCGNVWHSTKYNNDNSSHKLKYDECDEKGIRLITIFEDEWNNSKEIVKSRIDNILGLSNRIYARKCDIMEITNKEALDFCSVNHIQGKGQSKIAYGLFYNNELVSTMTFSKGSISKNGCKYDYELNRFCNKIGYSIVGGASKLFKKFISSNDFNIVVSYCDLRWGTGKVYDKLGMTLDGTTKEGYYYVGPYTNWKRKHRYNFTKSNLLKLFNGNPNNTEKELAEENQLYRLYDCGHKRFLYIK